MSTRVKTYCIIGLLVVVGVAAWWLTGGKAEPVMASAAHARTVNVEVAQVEASPIRKIIELPGRISAFRVAEVRARVAGIILSRDFVEGSYVEKGQPLFHIDPAQFLASMSQAKADLAKAQASMVDLESTAIRYGKLIKTKSISQSEYDTAVSSYQAAKAARDAAEAAVRTASLSLSYATVTAPISGRIGRAAVTEGALVGQNDATYLATIQQLDPIYADINQPVAEYLTLKAAMSDAVRDEQQAKVTVFIDNIDYTETGKLLFSDVTVDQDTGQVSLRSQFANKDGMLLPGMFVRIKIELGKAQQGIFVPQRAVSRDADGSAHVFVMNAQNVVTTRMVTTGPMTGGKWRILKGLEFGETIVVNGVDKLRDGMTVAVVTPASADAKTTTTVQ